MTSSKLHGLVAATHTPFAADGELDPGAIEAQAEFLAADGVDAVFIGGTTGECHSLTIEERLALADRWAAVAKGSPLKLVVHVGANSLADAKALAAQAQRLGAAAISALAPSYFKPGTLGVLVDCCREVAAAAPALPFYYYDIPPMTGVRFPMPDFLDAAEGRIPTLAGIKFSNPDLMAYQRCLRAHGGRFDIPWGIDEYILAALAVGCRGGVGSSYNFAAPIYVRLIEAFRKGDLDAAREEQFRSVRLVQLLADFGYMAAAKAIMGMLGAPVGPPRLPNADLGPGRREELRSALDQLGFFEWRKSPRAASRAG
jgi:N-acetylneuraminate lyase